jgi:hypothetical protein
MDRRDIDYELKQQAEGVERQRRLGEQKVSGSAGQSDVATRVMDKRVCQQTLHVRANELEQQAVGLRRLAEIIGAAGDYDYPLFTAVLTLAK